MRAFVVFFIANSSCCVDSYVCLAIPVTKCTLGSNRQVQPLTAAVVWLRKCIIVRNAHQIPRRGRRRSLSFRSSLFMSIPFTDEMKNSMRVSYALRWVPVQTLSTLLPFPDSPRAGDIVLARLEKIGRDAGLELANGRRWNL